MTCVVRLWLSAVLALAWCQFVSADEEVADAPPADVERWIQLLGSDSFVQRDFAARQLLHLGKATTTPLIGIAKRDDETAAQAAIQLLSRIARDDQGEMGTAAHRGLADLVRDAESLPPARVEVIRQSLRIANRLVAASITTRGGLIERSESLEIIGVKVQEDRFTDEQADLLARLPGLKRLDLRDTLVSDESIDVIRVLPQLEELNLSDTAVTGEGLLRLTTMTSLTKLSAYRLQISPEQLRALRSQLPDCEIRN